MSESPPDVTLEEHDTSDPIELSRREESVLTDLRVGDTDNCPLGVTHERGEEACIESNSAIGTVRLPSGRRVTVTPKETIGRLLSLLAYATDTPATTVDATADFEQGATFHRVLATLFETELRTVLQSGLAESYTDHEGVRDHLRGRLDVQRQLRRPTAGAPTTFAVDYRTATTQTTLNQAVAVAAERLQELLADERRGVGDTTDTVTRRLRRSAREWRDRLDGPVPETVSLRAVDQIELSRLTDHYAALLALTRTVLSASFFDDLRPGERRGRALFVDANDVFERVLERAVRAAVDGRSYTVVPQATVPALVQGPHGADTVRPDVVVARTADVGSGATGRADDLPLSERAVAVLDAKWKPQGASGRNATQMAGYCLALDTPGALVFPDTEELATIPSTVDGEHELHSLGLPTDATCDRETYIEQIEEAVRTFLDDELGL